MIGHALATELYKDPLFAVTACDIDEQKLFALSNSCGIQTKRCDLRDRQKVSELLVNYDLVVNATPGFMGYSVFKSVIEAKKNIVDIAFFPEDALALHDLACRNGVIAITDCGVAPGLSNIWIAEAASRLDEIDSAVIYVGGLPANPTPPFFYKAVFSPADVIELYTRPARYIENGKLVVKPALSDVELLDFPGIGTLEAFNTDGLRSLAHTIKAKTIKEKTLRYPGHIEKMALLREIGFFSDRPVRLNQFQVRPIDLTSILLFPLWEMKIGDEDLTVMRVVVAGSKAGKSITFTYEMIDHFDRKLLGYTFSRSCKAQGAVMALAEATMERIPERVGCG